MTEQEPTGHTLKTWRIPLSSDLQPAIFPLSLLAAKNLKISRRLVILSIFCRIFSTVLPSGLVGERTGNVYGWTNSHLQPAYRITHGLVEVAQLLSIRSSFEGITYTSTE